MKTFDETADPTMPEAMGALDAMQADQPGAKSDTSMAEDCVPVDALSQPDEQEQLSAPQVGDRVSYTTDGTVTRIEGGNAYVKRESVNGQPVEPDADNAGGPPDNDADDSGMGGGY